MSKDPNARATVPRAGVRGRLLTLCLAAGLLLTGCKQTYHVLADNEGRPIRIYEDAISCQFSAVWHSNRGMHGAECYEMSEAELLFRGVDISKIGDTP